jgi:hypothetical protein
VRIKIKEKVLYLKLKIGNLPKQVLGRYGRLYIVPENR